MIIHRIPFTTSAHGYGNPHGGERSFLLSVYSELTPKYVRRTYRVEILDLGTGRVAASGTYENPFVAQAMIAKYLDGSGKVHLTPDLLRAEREALFQRGRYGKESA